jgi:hypothetical protein
MNAPASPPADPRKQKLAVGLFVLLGLLLVGQYIHQVYRDLARTAPPERFRPPAEAPAVAAAPTTAVAVAVAPTPTVAPAVEDDGLVEPPTRLWSLPERASALSEYVVAVGQLLDLAKAGRLAEGRPHVERWLSTHPEHPRREDMARQLDWITLGAAWSAPLEKNPQLLNFPLVFSEGATVNVQRIENGRLHHVIRRVEGVQASETALSAAPAYQLVQLLQAAAPTGATARIATWLMNRGQLREALVAIQRGVLAGESGGRVEEWARDWQAAQRNRQAYALIDQAEKALNAGRGPEAQRYLQELHDDFVDCDVVMWAASNTLAGLTTRLSELPEPEPTAPTEIAAATPATVAPLEVDKDFGLSELMRAQVRARIQAETTNVTPEASWTDRLAYLDRGLLSALQLAAALPRERRYDAVIKQDFLSLLLAQSAFIRRVGTDKLSELTADETVRPFLAWLFGHRPALEDFLLSIAPSTDAAATLRLWSELWTEKPASREKYHRIALACALVFDQPVRMIDEDAYGSGDVDMKARFQYYVDADAKKGLKTDIVQMPAWELVWVVDAPVPNSELEWARTKVSYAQRDWGKAYGSIRYRMDKISKGKSIYEKYTLDEIKCEGGTCGDQAHYAATTAKANGIPAMVISGDGDLGGHAWMGYKASSKEWNLGAGRLGASYANGGTTDPQTRQGIGEKSILLLADPQRRADGWLASHQMTWLSFVFRDRGETDKALLAIKTALAVSPRDTDAFDALVALLESSTAKPEQWSDALKAAKLAFREFPDQIKKINELELQLAVANEGAAGAAELARRQRKRMDYRYEDRRDLLLQNIDREAGLLTEAGDLKGVESLYRKALFDYGDHAVMFRSLLDRYIDFARQQDDLRDALWFVSNRLNQHQGEPKWNSYFEVNVYATLLDKLAGLYEEDQQSGKAERMRKKADRMREYAKQFTK